MREQTMQVVTLIFLPLILVGMGAVYTDIKSELGGLRAQVETTNKVLFMMNKPVAKKTR